MARRRAHTSAWGRRYPFASIDTMADSRPFPGENVELPPRATRLAYILGLVDSISLNDISGPLVMVNMIGSYSSPCPFRIKCKMRTSVKLSPMCSSPFRYWNTSVRYKSGSWFGFMVVPFSVRIKIRRRCIGELKSFTPPARRVVVLSRTSRQSA